MKQTVTSKVGLQVTTPSDRKPPGNVYIFRKIV